MEKKRKSLVVLNLKMTKIIMIVLALVVLIGLAGIAESMSNSNLFGAVVSILIVFGSLVLINRISKTKNFKMVNRLETSDSLGEELK